MKKIISENEDEVGPKIQHFPMIPTFPQCNPMIHQNDHHVSFVILVPHMNDLRHSGPLKPRICAFT